MVIGYFLFELRHEAEFDWCRACWPRHRQRLDLYGVRGTANQEKVLFLKKVATSIKDVLYKIFIGFHQNGCKSNNQSSRIKWSEIMSEILRWWYVLADLTWQKTPTPSFLSCSGQLKARPSRQGTDPRMRESHRQKQKRFPGQLSWRPSIGGGRTIQHPEILWGPCGLNRNDRGRRIQLVVYQKIAH